MSRPARLPLVAPESDASTGPAPSEPKGPVAIEVPARERTVVGPELGAFVASIPSPEARRPYEELLAQVDAGRVEGPLVDRLESFLELAITTGRLKNRLGLHAEEAAKRLFEKTPRGAAMAASAGEVTKALESLVGGTIAELRLTLVRPGSYRLVLETEKARVSVGLAPAGAHVESVELTI